MIDVNDYLKKLDVLKEYMAYRISYSRNLAMMTDFSIGPLGVQVKLKPTPTPMTFEEFYNKATL